MKKHELIIFDLGRVLVDFDFMKVIQGLKNHTAMTSKDIHAYFKKTPLWDRFERGHVKPAAFFKELKKDLKLGTLEFEVFVPLWNDIFQEKKDSLEILKKLRKRYRLAMISNVNEMHWLHVKKHHSFMEWFEHPIASYAVGHRKPELEIFHLTLKRAKVEPSKAIFIDDLAAHTRAAKSIGIRSHTFTHASKLKKDLEDVLE